MSKLSILHTAAGLHPKFGGPSRTVAQLTDALAGLDGLDVTLLSQSRSREPTVPSNNAAIHRRVLQSSSAIALKFGLPFWWELQRIAKQTPPSVIHDHGLWLATNHWASQTARRFEIPLVLHPRGMLEPWALKHKARKKRIALALYQRSGLETAKVLVATADAEYQHLRKLGLTQPIALIPNGVCVHWNAMAQSSLSRSIDAPRIALFLSRIYPVKGLTNLIRAWAQLSPIGWRLQIAGPNEGGHLAEVLALVEQYGISNDVEYIGEVDDAAKSALYRGADVFVLPTLSENFGVVVAEALAHGVPVITTKGAPWADLQTYGCGWWIDVGVEPLAQALRDAMALSDVERQAMGSRGREYVRRYDWDEVATHMVAVYRWVLSQGPRPDCVHLA